ncbi:preATP grasp domain-containing protein [Salinactinospora qingdaonensis]|uniref:ATP-grasp domain-containing protein n=1 Tax=Salinactinospora qingdaonensis TaxID=702744 RepID=A0ABP7G6Y3_9ACTN
MRLLIGNHIDDSIRLRPETRAWTQRILWFARDGDLIVLPDQPDTRFVNYVTALTGVNPATLRFHTPSGGRYGHHSLDPLSLTSPEFVAALAGDLGDVEEVFALWPSAQVSRLSEALGVADRFPGSNFFAQGGGEVANNKAVFRALAAGCGVAVAPGAVCRSRAEAAAATRTLLETADAVMVKQAHNGAGVGNQIVVRDPAMATGHAGARHHHELPPGPGSVDAFWEQRWSWASVEGHFPVVVEEFQPSATSIYAEFHVSGTGVHPTEAGTLHYADGRLSHQIVPLRSGNRRQLVGDATRLAQAYQALGYRGYLSTDALLQNDGRIIFTEVNAQVSGSLHIYQVIAHSIVWADAAPQRLVVEYHVPPHWSVPSFDVFLQAIDDLGVAYDPRSRRGVIVSMPIIALEPDRARFVFCIAYDTDEHRRHVYALLDERFTTNPASQTIAPVHVTAPSSSRAWLGRSVDAPSVSTWPAPATRLRPTFEPALLAGDLSRLTGHDWAKQRIHSTSGVGAEAQVDWRVLPLRSTGGDPERTDPGGPGAEPFAPTPWAEQAPYIAEIVDSIPAPVNAARLMALAPGALSAEHCDPKYALTRGLVRIHLPLSTNPGAILVLDGTAYRWQPGQLWFGEFARPHLVRNNGAATRIHLVIDALLTVELADWFPNDWAEAMHAGAALINRPTAAPPSSPATVVRLPESFLDFSLTDGRDHIPTRSEPTVEARVEAVAEQWRLTVPDGRTFALVHLGDREFRFCGWSEQRTLQLRGSDALLRARTPTSVHSLPVPARLATQ